MSMNSDGPPSDRELCEAVRSADERVARAAFEQLWQRHRRVVWGVICRLHQGPSEAAKDLYEHVCVRLWMFLRTTPQWQLQQATLLPFLGRCIQYGFVDYLRKRRRERAVESLDELAEQGIEPSHGARHAPREGLSDGDSAQLMLGLLSTEALGSSELAKQLGMSSEQLKIAGADAGAELREWGETRFLQAIYQLSPRLRDAFILQEGYGFHQDEIHVILGISKSAAGQRVAEAKWQVRKSYTQQLLAAGYTLREIAIALGLLEPAESSTEVEAEACAKVNHFVSRDKTRRKKGGTTS